MSTGLFTGGTIYDYYVDGSDAEVEGNWVYSDGEPVNFLMWRNGEPSGVNFAFGEEDCLTFAAFLSSYVGFNDISCQSSTPAVCELDGKLGYFNVLTFPVVIYMMS